MDMPLRCVHISILINTSYRNHLVPRTYSRRLAGQSICLSKAIQPNALKFILIIRANTMCVYVNFSLKTVLTILIKFCTLSFSDTRIQMG